MTVIGRVAIPVSCGNGTSPPTPPAVFLPGLAGRHEHDLVQREDMPYLARGDQVAMVIGSKVPPITPIRLAAEPPASMGGG